jgi:thioredoxin reductase (NADPH)
MIPDVLTEKQTLSPKNGELFDIIIIGAGPAGMSAALCAARSRLKVLLIEKTLPGGETSTAYRIYNYPGFPNGILGSDLANKMETHLMSYPIYYSCESVYDIANIAAKEKTVCTNLGFKYKTKSVVIASGLEPKELDTEFERQFLGRGVSYYAQGDWELYQGKEVAVIGGGNCACYAAEHLADIAKSIYLVHRSDQLKAVKTLREKVINNPKITIMWDTILVDIFGIEHVEKMKLEHITTKQHTWIDTKCIFIYVGRKPPQDIVNLEVDIDEEGYIITDECMRTNMPGIYAAGDIRSKQIRQISTAVSDGMIAAINAEKDFDRNG